MYILIAYLIIIFFIVTLVDLWSRFLEQNIKVAFMRVIANSKKKKLYDRYWVMFLLLYLRL
jgi:hypothetical protein